MRRIGILIAVLASAVFLGASAPAGALLGLGLSATTNSATNVNSTSAVLKGTVSPLSLSTSYYFDIGTTTSYGTQTPVTYVTSLLSSQSVQATVTGLKPSTTYHFRLVTGEALSVAKGADMTFKTPAGQNSQGQNTNTQGTGTGTSTNTTTTPTTDSSSGDNQGSDGSGTATTTGAAGTDASPAFPDNPPVPTNVTPVLGTSIAATPAAGVVNVRMPGSAMFVPLEGDASLPVGTTVDARKGTISLLAAVGGAAAPHSGEFQGAMFKVNQGAHSGVTDLYLTGGDVRPCWPAVARGLVAARKRPRTIRRLWGHDHGGRFRTHGQRAVATVRGTTWMVADRCDGTLTKVTDGAVSVKDRVRRKTVLVRAGHSYLARARR